MDFVSRLSVRLGRSDIKKDNEIKFEKSLQQLKELMAKPELSELGSLCIDFLACQELAKITHLGRSLYCQNLINKQFLNARATLLDPVKMW